MRNTWIILIGLVVTFALASCAHQSQIPPSTAGHINDQQAAKTSTAADIPKPVKSTAFVPMPTAKVKEQTYSVVVNEVPVKEVLFALARESKLNIDINPSIQGRVTLNAVDQTLPVILERLSKQVDLIYKQEGNVLSITPDFPTFRTYKVNYVNMDRDTTGSIGVATEIASTGAAATTDSSSSGSSSSSTGNSSAGSSSTGNSSKTTVNSSSKNKFWESLADNVRIILKTTKTQAVKAEEKMARAEAAQLDREDRLKQVEAVSKAGPGAEKLLQEAFKTQPTNVDSKDEVIINPAAGTLTVMGTERQQGFIQQYLDTVMASVLRQVLIEATIVEVVLNDTYQFGIDWTLVAGNFSFAQLLTNNPLRGTLDGSRNGLLNNNFVAGYSSDNLKAALTALETFGNTHVLSSPKMMALNNQTAILKVVDNLVYFTIQETSVEGNVNTNNSIATTSTPHTVPVGVVMSVTPQISDNGRVTLIVRPTISRQSGEVEDPANRGSFIPQIQVREMESVLEVGSGKTVVLGGLMQDAVQNKTEGVPVLSKLPLVGKLFESNNDKTTKSELVIFLRPTVITHASLESDELRSFKQYLPTQPQQALDEPVN